VQPYYADDTVTLFHGDCRDIPEWLQADVLVTDPPYGRNWKQGNTKSRRRPADSHQGIVGDQDTTMRDAVLLAWGTRPAIVFGDLLIPAPTGTKQVGAYRKPVDTGTKGAHGGFRRDVEGFYLVGSWRAGLGGTSSVLATTTPMQGGSSGPSARYGHPHAKPLDILLELIGHCPPGAIADPFAGSGSTLVAAKQLGRRAIGVEVDERYCEMAARRLSQGVLPFADDVGIGKTR
jgi:site-specific DNA-methyltransferase (adenine-specific)